MWHAKQLVLHGGIIVLIGLLCGAPLGSAVVRKRGEEAIRAWRVAHTSLVMGGIFLLAVAGIVADLKLSASALNVLVWTLVAASYAFAVVLPTGARYQHRGLAPSPPFLNQALYGGNIAGAAGLLIGTASLVWGAYAAL